MASFVSGSCRYLAWEDAKRSANETNNNAIILEDHHVPCSLRVTSSHKTLAFYARKSRGLYCAESDFYFLNLEQKSLSFCDTSSKEGKFTVSLKHDLNFANIICSWKSLKETKTWLGKTPYSLLRNFPAQNKHRVGNPKLSRESSSTFWPFRNSWKFSPLISYHPLYDLDLRGWDLI